MTCKRSFFVFRLVIAMVTVVAQGGTSTFSTNKGGSDPALQPACVSTVPFVVNPGFDQRPETPGAERGWGAIPSPYKVLPREGMNGTQALYFDSEQGGSHPRVLQEINVVPGRQYRHSVMIKIDQFKSHNERGATTGFFYYNKDGKQIGSYARDGVRNSDNCGYRLPSQK